MAANEDIGKGYKRRLDGYQESPSDNVWERIESKLDENRRRIFPLWLYFGGIGVLLLSLGTWYFVEQTTINNDHENPNNIVNQNGLKNQPGLNNQHNLNASEKSESEEDLLNDEIHVKHSDSANTTEKEKIASYTVNKNKSLKNTLQKSTNIDSKANEEFINSVNSILLNNAISNLQPYAIVFFNLELTPFTFEFPKLEEDTKSKKTKEESSSSWDVKIYGGPSYFNNFASGNSLDASLVDNDGEGNIQWNFGIMVNFQVNERSTVSLGIERFEGSYTTLNADITSESGVLVNSSSFTGIDFNPGALINNPLGSSSEIDLSQQFTFIEFPLQYSYQILKSKINWDVYGGIGFVVLSNDQIFAESSNGNRIAIGNGSNLNKTFINASFGTGISYDLSKQFILSLEPRFKYYFKPVNDNSKFNPFALGIGFGIRYKL